MDNRVMWRALLAIVFGFSATSAFAVDATLPMAKRTPAGAIYFPGSPSNFVLDLPQACPANQWAMGSSTSTGLPICVQPSYANIGGTLTGDCASSGAAITCTKTNGAAFTAAATTSLGTSGATLGLLNANKTDSGNNVHSGIETFLGAFAAQNAAPGYSGFVQGNTPDGTRRWYLGNGDGGANAIFTGDNGWGIKLISPILQNATVSATPATGDSSNKVASTANVDAKIAAATAAIPRGYLSGLTTANNATNPTTQLDVVPGMATSDDNLVTFSLASTMTKTLSAWASGTGNGGLDTGSAAATTWYHVFAIYNPTTPATDVLLSLSPTAPTLPSGYTKKRRIGSIKTTGTATNILAFVQNGDDFNWQTLSSSADFTGAPTTANRTLITANTPLGIITKALISVSTSVAGSTQNVLITNPAQADVAASGANNGVPFSIAATRNDSTAANYVGAQVQQYTNTSSQVGLRGSNTTNGVTLQAVGWTDTRGK